MKNHRYQFNYRQSASKLHKKIGDILRTSPLFQNFRIYQEYPVSKINSRCLNNRLSFDWIVLDLKLVIEIHGKQHFEISDFSGKAEDGGLGAFSDIKYRDKLKQNFAEESGWTYIMIPYYDIKLITDKDIMNLYKKNFNSLKEIEHYKTQTPFYSVEKRQEYLESDYYKEQLKDARQKRHDAYERNKQRIMEYRKQRKE